jgi:hypothetical protein
MLVNQHDVFTTSPTKRTHHTSIHIVSPRSLPIAQFAYGETREQILLLGGTEGLRRKKPPSVPHSTDDKEETMSARAPSMTPENNGSDAKPSAEKPSKITFYMRNRMINALKKRAIDENTSYSKVVENAVDAYLQTPIQSSENRS